MDLFTDEDDDSSLVPILLWSTANVPLDWKFMFCRHTYIIVHGIHGILYNITFSYNMVVLFWLFA